MRWKQPFLTDRSAIDICDGKSYGLQKNTKRRENYFASNFPAPILFPADSIKK